MPDLDLLRAELRELRDVVEPFYGEPTGKAEAIFALGFVYAKVQAALAILGPDEKPLPDVPSGIKYPPGVIPCSGTITTDKTPYTVTNGIAAAIDTTMPYTASKFSGATE